MQFVYDKNASSPLLTIEDETYKYLFRARRKKIGDIIDFRNLQDDKLYSYRVVSIDKKSASLELIYGESKPVVPAKDLTIGWCIIDPKNIEKTLPSLNEIGVKKIVFIRCAYTQANFKIKKERLEKILINSSQQCGRSSLMKIEFAQSLQDFLSKYLQSYLLNFSQNRVSENRDIDSIVVGCEGGLSKDEIKLFTPEKVVGLNTPTILRSESAVVAVASKIVL